jgi:AraC family ethanolamine operon transcriptional activator
MHPAGVWVRHVEATDVDQLGAAQQGWALHCEQLSAGPFRGEVRMVQLPGLRLVHERSNRGVRRRGRLGADGYGFALPLELQGEAFFAGQRVEPDSIMMGRGDDLDLCAPAAFAFIAIVAERALLEPLWRHMYGKPLARWLERQLVVGAAAAPAAALRTLHLAAMARAAGQPSPLDDEAAVVSLRDALLIEWIEAIPAAVDAHGADTVAARRRLVDRACALMQARPDQPPTMLELCAQAGASPRKLGYCFRDVLGVSPARYLRALRLNAARRALKGAGDPKLGVQDVAARLGFWHFGQFAADYRRQFGELPSHTLEAGRADAAHGASAAAPAAGAALTPAAPPAG